MTRVCSRRVTHRPGGAGDDNILPISGLSARTRFRGWATLSEHKWSSFGERRSRFIGFGGLQPSKSTPVAVSVEIGSSRLKYLDAGQAGQPASNLLRGH